MLARGSLERSNVFSAFGSRVCAHLPLISVELVGRANTNIGHAMHANAFPSLGSALTAITIHTLGYLLTMGTIAWVPPLNEVERGTFSLAERSAASRR
jgi:hypothetical protein